MISRVKQGLRLAGISVTFRQDSPTSKLHQFFGGLNDRAQVDAIARYVVDGTDASILSTLQHPSWQDTWAKRTRYWPQRDEHQLFSDLSSWQIDQMRRFGEVLAALEPLRHDWGMFGTRASPDWLRHVVTIWLGAGRKAQPLTVLIDLVAGGDASTSAALDIVFCRDGATYGTHNSVGRFAEVGAWLDAAHASITVATPGLAANARTELASSIGRFGLQDRYRDLLLDLAVGSSKKARASARQALTAADTPPLVAALETRFDGASPGQRAELIEVAAAALGDQAVALLTRWGEGETAPKVLAALNAVRGAVEPLAAEGQATPADGPAGYTGVDGRWIDAGPIPPPPPVMPVPEEVLRILDPAVQAFNDLLAAGKAEATGRQWHWSRQFRSKGDRDLRALAALAEGSEAMTPASFGLVVDWLRWHEFKHPGITAFFDDPRLSLRHLTRIAVAMSNCHLQGLMNDWAGPIGMAVQRRLAAGVDFRTFYQLWTEAGGIDVIGEYLTHRWYGNLPDMGVALWPLLCTRFHELDQALGLQPQTGAVEVRTSPGLELLGHFPVLPARYRNRLMLLAGDSGSRIRDSARALLRGSPGIDAAIAEQLGDSRRDVRALAAEWLAARKAVDQAPLIRAALASEKADLPRAAMITALDRLGEDVSAWFDHDLLKRDAEAALAKPLPKGLDWFPFDVLPSLHWADGAPVDPMLPRHWLVLSAKLKQPGGNAMIDLWLDRLAPGDAHRLGWRVLTTWIDEDSRQPSEEEAHAHARLHVDAVLQANIANAQRWPESASYFPTDRDLVFAQLKRAKASEYLGSAVDSKGVLALATRVEGAAAAGRIRAFLKDHGARTSQAKALLDLLASIGSGAALQLLLSAANRSKQRSVQAHAAALVEAIAERRGWSPAQLADRTIPTGGFDPDGTQDVHLGDGRTYRLRLDDDAVVILNAEGREVKSLPGPRTDAEKPQADAARQQLATARKAVKQVFAAQIARLHEAMLLQRRWDVEEWDTFIAAHPIVGRIAARLIWQGLDEHGAVSATFRPLGDGSLTDAFDKPVSLAATAQVRLAHSTLLDPAEAAAWQQHLIDYGVAPAFDQLGRALPVLGDDDRDARSIEDRVGWMIETFTLRGHATRLGYTRGAAEDGGWYHGYEKPFREAGLVVEIAFSGSPLPEENRVAALGALTFRRARPGGGTGPVVLGDVPAVLLAECWRDLHDLADRGTGYDPDWQRKV